MKNTIEIRVRERHINGVDCWASEIWLNGICYFTTTHLGKAHAMKLAFDAALALGLKVGEVDVP